MEQQTKLECRAQQGKSQSKNGLHNNPMSFFDQLSARIGKDQQSLFQKIEAIFFKEYSKQQKETIFQLIAFWDQFDLQDLLQMEQVTKPEVIKYYKLIQILSARVYSKVIAYIKSIRNTLNQQTKSFKLFLSQEELVFSYSRYFWKKRIIKGNSGYSYGSFGYKYKQPQQIKQSHKYSLQVNKWIETCNIPLLKKVHQFMIAIDLITLSEDQEPHNKFISKIERIQTEDQKVLYFQSLKINSLENIKTLHCKNFKTTTQEVQIQKQLKSLYPNYYFYKHQYTENKQIQTLHKKFQDYKFLEERHDYIQWMFPNHYGSAFNSSSYPLNYLQKRLFINDKEFGLKMLKSIFIFLDFMGIRLNLHTLELTQCNHNRLTNVIIRYSHNHLRIMRILACLSVTGFREIALRLINFLDEKTQKNNLLQRERTEFENSWQIYGNMSENVPKKRARTMCFLEDQVFPQRHIILKDLQKFASTFQEKETKIDLQDEQILEEKKQEKEVKQEFERKEEKEEKGEKGEKEEKEDKVVIQMEEEKAKIVEEEIIEEEAMNDQNDLKLEKQQKQTKAQKKDVVLQATVEDL